MNILRTVALGSVVAITTIVPAGARAQLGGALVFTPYVGVYAPSNDIGRMLVTAPGGSAEAWARHQSAAAFGANASYWMTDHMAIEGGLVYSSSDLKGTVLTNLNGTTASESPADHANVWLGSAKFMVQLLPPESDFNLRFGIGPAIITRNGTAYKDSEGTVTGLTDVGAAMSLCTRIAVTPKIGLRIRAEDFMYQAKLGFENHVNPSDSFAFGARTQHDFVFSAGLQLFLNR